MDSQAVAEERETKAASIQATKEEHGCEGGESDSAEAETGTGGDGDAEAPDAGEGQTI